MCVASSLARPLMVLLYCWRRVRSSASVQTYFLAARSACSDAMGVGGLTDVAVMRLAIDHDVVTESGSGRKVPGFHDWLESFDGPFNFSGF